jgi:hypothetical protein
LSDSSKPAFPVCLGTQHDQYFSEIGLTKREYFAAQAMNGLLTRDFLTTGDAAYLAVRAADELIEELKQ